MFQASSPLVEAQSRKPFAVRISVVFPPPTRTENHAMRRGFLQALSALLAGHGLALAQQIGSSPDPIGRETPPVGNRAPAYGGMDFQDKTFAAIGCKLIKRLSSICCYCPSPSQSNLPTLNLFHANHSLSNCGTTTG